MPEMPSRAPYGAYATILGSFAGSLAVVAALERALGRTPRPGGPVDLAVLCAATFKAARAISRERVGSVVREPFVEVEVDPLVGEPVEERPAGQGLRRAVGELVTCTRCAGTWAAGGLIATQVLAPRFGRLLTWSLAAGAGNDFLQAGFAALCARADDER
jgi:hypothetical protein